MTAATNELSQQVSASKNQVDGREQEASGVSGKKGVIEKNDMRKSSPMTRLEEPSTTTDKKGAKLASSKIANIPPHVIQCEGKRASTGPRMQQAPLEAKVRQTFTSSHAFSGTYLP